MEAGGGRQGDGMERGVFKKCGVETHGPDQGVGRISPALSPGNQGLPWPYGKTRGAARGCGLPRLCTEKVVSLQATGCWASLSCRRASLTLQKWDEPWWLPGHSLRSLVLLTLHLLQWRLTKGCYVGAENYSGGASGICPWLWFAGVSSVVTFASRPQWEGRQC